MVIESNCNKSANKSNHPIQNPLLLVTDLWTRDNIFITNSVFGPGCYSFIGWGDMDWIHVAQDKDKRRALVNTVMKLPVP
jgi:hypothetical protein